MVFCKNLTAKTSKKEEFSTMKSKDLKKIVILKKMLGNNNKVWFPEQKPLKILFKEKLDLL
jgi:hypothetical protein